MITEIELEDITEYADGVAVYNCGSKTLYGAGEEKFNEICAGWRAMTDGAHQMPAFGVSLNEQTLVALKEGIWAEFTFPRTFSSDGMPYEKLLINVNRGWSGFNIIRYNAQSGYDGRCFYYDLVGKDMDEFYDCLIK